MNEILRQWIKVMTFLMHLVYKKGVKESRMMRLKVNWKLKALQDSLKINRTIKFGLLGMEE